MRLPAVAVAGGAGEIHRPLAAEEQRLAQRQRFLLLGVRRGGPQTSGRCDLGHVGGERLQLGARSGWPWSRALDELGVLEALQLLHAPHDARFQVHHPVGIGEVARQLGEGAFDLARPLPRSQSSSDTFLGPRFSFQGLAAVGIEQAGIDQGRPSASGDISRARARCHPGQQPAGFERHEGQGPIIRPARIGIPPWLRSARISGSWFQQCQPRPGAQARILRKPAACENLIVIPRHAPARRYPAARALPAIPGRRRRRSRHR